jgi:hypothetical protein
MKHASTSDWAIQGNPAFVAATLGWLCEGYGSASSRGLFPLWGMVGLALIAPDRVRAQLPVRPTKKLGNLVHEHPLWRGLSSDVIRCWASPFWLGLRLAVGVGLVSVEGGRLFHASSPEKPRNDFEKEVRQASTTFGKVMAKEPSDTAIGTLLGLRVLP